MEQYWYIHQISSRQKPNWKIQHDELHENIRNAREITKAVKEGKPVPPPTKPAGMIASFEDKKNFLQIDKLAC